MKIINGGIWLCNERITFISIFDDINIEKIKYYIKQISDKLCKVPFGKNVDNRIEVDTLPYHFTLSVWNIEDKAKVRNIHYYGLFSLQKL